MNELTMQEADLQGHLRGIKFILALTRCCPVTSFPADKGLRKSLNQIQSKFHRGVILCYKAAILDPEAANLITEDLVTSLVPGANIDYYDNETIDLMLSVYSYERRLNPYCYTSQERLIAQVKPIVEKLFALLFETILYQRLLKSADRVASPIEDLETAVLDWMGLMPTWDRQEAPDLLLKVRERARSVISGYPRSENKTVVLRWLS